MRYDATPQLKGEGTLQQAQRRNAPNGNGCLRRLGLFQDVSQRQR